MQERALARQGLTGFGWRGWLAVGILVGLIAATWAGFDAYVLLLRGLARAFGANAPMAFVSYWLIWERLAWTQASLSLVTVVVIVPVLRLEPGRFPWGRLGVLILASAVLPLAPELVYWYAGGLNRLLSFDYALPAVLGGGTGMFPLGQVVVAAMLSAAVVWWVTRSVAASIAALVVALAFIGLSVGECLGVLPVVSLWPAMDVAAPVVWHLAILLPAFRAAWNRRLEAARRALGFSTCPRCAYDLREISGERCPECGSVVPPATGVAAFGS